MYRCTECRYPRTKQLCIKNGDRCNNGILEFEGHIIRIRAKRSKAQVVLSGWDDKRRVDQKDRSWKRHRKTQYKCKNSG